MWIATNKSFLSIVEDVNNNSRFVVRARIRGDIEAFFDDEPVTVIETSDSDYRFRVFADKELVSSKIQCCINNINYHNFKGSVKERDREMWYLRIWAVMHDVQEKLYGNQGWVKYFHDKNTKRATKRV